jgi:hypothetical protein
MYCSRATSVASEGRSVTAAMRANSLSSQANPCLAIVTVSIAAYQKSPIFCWLLPAAAFADAAALLMPSSRW